MEKRDPPAATRDVQIKHRGEEFAAKHCSHKGCANGVIRGGV